MITKSALATAAIFARSGGMRKIPILAASLAAATLLAGCATPNYYSPVEVTRFVAPDQGAARVGPIGLRPAQGQDPASGEYVAFQMAVRDELQRQGFQVAGADAPYIALIGVDRYVLNAGRRSPVSVGGGGSVGSYGSGVGLGVGINLTPPDPDQIVTELTVSIRPAAGGTAIWEGRASFNASANNQFADS